MTKKNKVKVGYNTSKNEIHASVKGIRDENLDVTFVKDPEQLLYQYDNLIRSLGSRYSKWCKSKEDRENLYSYIKDAFISLVTEYDPLSGVDFPGYIKSKLSLRVYNSYLTSERDYVYRNTVLKNGEVTPTDILNNRSGEVLVSTAGTPPTDKEPYKGMKNIGIIKRVRPTNTSNLSLIEGLTDISINQGLDEFQIEMLQEFVEGANYKNIINIMKGKHPEYSNEEIESSFEDFKNILRNYYDLSASY